MNVTLKTCAGCLELDPPGHYRRGPAGALEKVAAQYAVAITPAMAGLIDRADPNDPIARQFVPDARELATEPEERADPIGDDAHSPVRASCIAIPTACC